MSAAVQMRPFPEASNLVHLARSKTPDDRERLLIGIAALCEAQPPSEAIAPVLAEIFTTLAAQAEREIRLLLSEHLASADWAPPALINMLALDEIAIARPIITSSPLLRDAELMKILIEATLEHQIAVARRPHLSGGIADAIIDRGDPVIMTALASNRTAEISESSLRRLVEHSRRIAGLRAPLTRHPRLNEALAVQLYQWVGEALRQSISERFRVDPDILKGVIQAGAIEAAGVWRTIPIANRRADERERQEMERRLVDKLRAAGQLRPGILIRALREERLALFETALGVLSGFTPGQVRGALLAPTAEPLYLACLAVGVDRAILGSILPDVRKLNNGLPGEGAWTATTITPDNAARAFRQMMETSAAV